MDFAKWLSEFRVAHQKAKKDQLSPQERDRYLADRNELARAVLASQKIQIRAGQQPRTLLKASRVLPVEIEINGRMRALMTLEVSAEGFSALTGDTPANDRPVQFSLKVPTAREPVTGEAMLVQATKQMSSYRCQLRFEGLGEIARESIEMLVFDDLLDHLKA